MTVKSIVDIDVNDSQFQAFTRTFAKYQDALTKMPAAWEAATDEAKEQQKSFNQMAAALFSLNDLQRRGAANSKNAAASNASSAVSWSKISSFTKSSADNIARMTTSILRWTGIATAFSGLMGVGSLWGLERLGFSAASGRRQSQGLGLSYGENKAFDVTFNRLVDTSSVLGGVATGKGDISSDAYAAMRTLGIDPQKGSAGDTALETLTEARRLARSVPKDQRGILLQSHRLGALGLGLQDLNRLADEDDSSFNSFKGDYAKRRSQLGVEDPLLKAWQNFIVSLDASSEKLKSSLIAGLAKLSEPLGKISEALSDVVQALVGSKGFKEIIEAIADGLKTFADYVSKDEFKRDIKDFVDNIGYAAKKIGDILRFLNILPSGQPSYHSKEGGASRAQRRLDSTNNLFSSIVDWFGVSKSTTNPDGSVTVRRTAGQPDDLLKLIEKLEGSPDINGKAQISPAGAVGKYQIMPKTAAGLGYDPNDRFDPAKNKEMAQKLLAELSGRYKGNLAEILADYNGGPKAVEIYRRGGIGELERSGGYKETANYLRRAGIADNTARAPTIKIENNTGGNAIVNAAGLGFPQ